MNIFYIKFLTMKAKKRKKLLVSLITDDLINYKLVHGLLELNLASGSYLLNLSATIIGLMGFRGDQNEVVFEHYMDLLERAIYVDNSENNSGFTVLAHEIYDYLQLQVPLPKDKKT